LIWTIPRYLQQNKVRKTQRKKKKPKLWLPNEGQAPPIYDLSQGETPKWVVVYENLMVVKIW